MQNWDGTEVTYLVLMGRGGQLGGGGGCVRRRLGQQGVTKGLLERPSQRQGWGEGGGRLMAKEGNRQGGGINLEE